MNRPYFIKPRNKDSKMKAKLAKVSAPASSSYKIQNINIPRITALRGAIVVNNTEMVPAVFSIWTGTIVIAAAGAASAHVVPLTPISFDWLTGIASNYSKFNFLKLKFTYVPSCSTATAGRIAIGIAYDNADSVSTVAQCASLWGGCIAPVYGTGDPLSIEVDVSRSNQPYFQYMGRTAYLAIADAKLKNQYSLGLLVAITDSGTAAATVGTLFVEYVVELTDPIPSVSNN